LGQPTHSLVFRDGRFGIDYSRVTALKEESESFGSVIHCHLNLQEFGFVDHQVVSLKRSGSFPP